MRIALVCDWYAPRRGGIETHLSGLAARLTEAGHQVHVITSTPGPANDGSVPVHRLGVRRLPFADVAFDFGLDGRIAEVLRRERIEIVHAHVSIVAPVALAGGLAAHGLQLPAVLTFHSFVPATPLWAGIASFLLESWQWNATMTAVSTRVIREVSNFAPRKRFSVLPNAVDADFWSPDPSASGRARNGPLTFVYSGRLHSKKRPGLAVDAFAELRRADPSLDCRLVVCGTGPMESSLRSRGSALGLGDSVQFIGWQEPAALREVYRAADVFLSPTHRESFGLAALEARAVGLPVVAMRDSGVADFIEHGTSGLLSGSDRDFADSVRALAVDASVRQSIRAHNEAHRPTLTWNNTIAKHLAIYELAVGAAAS